jgi:type II secretory pathway pseudopilin PulG
MSSLLSNKRAMTLAELIVVVLLVSIVIGAGIMPFIMQQGMLKTQMSRSNIQDQVSVAMAYINKDIFKAEEIVNIAGNSITLGIGTDILPGPDENITYSLNGNSLERNDGTNTVTVANNIASINFSNTQGNNLVEVTIIASDGTQDLTSTTTFALRATAAI